MPWEGPALLFIRKAAEMDALRTGMREVSAAVDDGQASLVFYDAEIGLITQIRRACERRHDVFLLEWKHRQEFGNAALVDGSLSVCTFVAADENQELRDLIQSWEMILFTIWKLHADLQYDP